MQFNYQTQPDSCAIDHWRICNTNSSTIYLTLIF